MTAELEKFIEESKWIFAKTMPESPHWYIVRSEENEDNFVALVKYIRENGYQAYYGDFARPFTYLEYNSYRYWTMGNPLPKTTIINRAEMALYEKIETPKGIFIRPREWFSAA